MEGAKRVFVIDRIETMSDAVANSMLKTLEEPAEYVHFVLMTSQPERVLPTISSRCQSVRFDAVPVSVIATMLIAEGIESDRATSCAALSGGDVALARELASEEGDAMRSEAGRIVGCALRGVSGRERPWEGVLSRAQEIELTAYRVRLNPADLARRIHELQHRLTLLAKDKTEQIYLSSFPTALPDVCKVIRVKAG